jgi:fumarate hydratase class I
MLSKNSQNLFRYSCCLNKNNNRYLATKPPVKPFHYQELFEHAKPLNTPFKKLTTDFVSTFEVNGKKVLQVEPQALTLIAEQAMVDIAHLLRPAHLQVDIDFLFA